MVRGSKWYIPLTAFAGALRFSSLKSFCSTSLQSKVPVNEAFLYDVARNREILDSQIDILKLRLFPRLFVQIDEHPVGQLEIISN